MLILCFLNSVLLFGFSTHVFQTGKADPGQPGLFQTTPPSPPGPDPGREPPQWFDMERMRAWRTTSSCRPLSEPPPHCPLVGFVAGAICALTTPCFKLKQKQNKTNNVGTQSRALWNVDKRSGQITIYFHRQRGSKTTIASRQYNWILIYYAQSGAKDALMAS